MKIKIDFVTPPFSGHLNPLIELALPLLGKVNFAIRFITGPQKIEFLQSLGFEAIPLMSDRPDVMESIANTTKPVKSSPLLLSKQLRENLSVLPDIKQEIRTLLIKNHTDIVIADFVAVPAGIVCEEHNIPWITVIPTPFAIETQEGTPSYLGGLNYANSPLAKIRDCVGRKISRLFKHVVGLWFSQELRAINFRIYRVDGSESAYSPYSILGLGLEEFEFKRDWPKQFKFIGPCCVSPEIISDLEIPFCDYDKVVLVTLGTHLEWAKNDLLENIDYLASHFPHMLFVISLGRSRKNEINPVYRGNNVLVYEYIPYSQYLDQFNAVIHHGGAGITYNCIKYLKPCLVVPHDYDQFDFAARIEHNGIGLRVRKIKSEEAVWKLRDILLDNRRNQLEKMNNQMQKYNPALQLEEEIYRVLS